MKSDLFTAPVQVAVALAVAAIPLLMTATDAWQALYGGGILAITVVAVMALPWHLTLTEGLRVFGMLLVLIVPIVTSILVNQPESSHAENIVVLACYAVLASVMFSEPRDRSFSRFFLLVAVTQGVAALVTLNILLVDSDNFFELFDRGTSRMAFEFEDSMHPNFIGLICVVMVFATLGIERAIWRAVILALGLVLCTAVSSRSGLLGVISAYASAELFRFIASERRHRFSTIAAYAGIAVLLLSGILLYSFHPADIVDFILDKVLLINDDERGLGTGATGRLEIWQAAFDLWLDHPLVGVGYQQSSAYIGFGLYAHNMILVILGDLGLFGLAGFLLFSVMAAWNARALWRSGQRLTATYVTTMLIVYFIYGVFEGRAVNAGNPLSAAFFLVTFASCGVHRRLPGVP